MQKKTSVDCFDKKWRLV